MPDSKRNGDKDLGDNYNLQEMMQKLQERPEEQGEIVTREDGSIAYKVKKRKRRSQQPHKEAQKKVRKLRLIQLGIAFFLLVAAAVGVATMLVYVNGNGYREKMLGLIQKTTGAKVSVVQFSVQPSKIIARELNMEWPAGNHLSRLDLKTVDAAVDSLSFFQKRLGGELVSAKSGALKMKLGMRDQPSTFEGLIDDVPFNFKTYRVDEMRVDLMDSDGKPWSYIEKATASISKAASGETQLRLSNGQLHLSIFGQYILDRAQIAFGKGITKFNRVALRTSEKNLGLLVLSGDVDLYSSEMLSLDLTLEDFPVSKLMGHGLSGYCNGNITTSADSINRYVRFQMGKEELTEINIAFSGSESMPFSLIQFPFIKTLSRELASQDLINGYQFRDKCKGQFIRTISSTSLTNLDLANEGKFAIRGNIASDGTELRGELFIGIGFDAFNDRSVSPNIPKIFLTEDNGYFWTSVKISGTPGAPIDDLDDKIKGIITSDAKNSLPTRDLPKNTSAKDELEQ